MESSTKDVIIKSTFTLNKLATDVGQGHTATAASYNDYSNFKNENCEVHDQIHLPSQKIGGTMSGISVQKNDAYGLVLTNTGISASATDLVNEPIVTPPMATMSCDLHTTKSASKDNSLSGYERIQLIHTVKHSHSRTTAENTCDRKSDSEHQSYEQVCTYEKVQSCDVQHLLAKEAPHQSRLSVHSNTSTTASTNARRQPHVAEHSHLCTTVSDHESDSEHQSYEHVCTYEKVQPCDLKLLHLDKEAACRDPSMHSKASKNACNDDSTSITSRDDETKASPAESLNSYERVWGYERIYHCDLPLEEFMAQKHDKGSDTN